MAWVRQLPRVALWVGVLLGGALIPPLSPTSAASYTVPPISKLVATLPGGAFGSDTHLLCLVRSEDPQGGQMPARAVCYSNFKPTPAPPPPPPPYRPLYHRVLVGALIQDGGLLVPVFNCAEFFPGVFAASLVLGIQLDKGGGTATGSAVLVTDTTAPFDCVGGTPTYGALTLTPLAQSHDEDGDGCSDWEELGIDRNRGGLRDPFNPWDFFDSDKNRVVTLIDILAVAGMYGMWSGKEGYDTNYDRDAVIGPNDWNLGPPNGVINIPDALAVARQFGNRCDAAP